MAEIPSVPAGETPIVPSVHSSLGSTKFWALTVSEREPAIATPPGGNQTPTPVAARTPNPLTAGDAVVARSADRHYVDVPPLPGGGR